MSALLDFRPPSHADCVSSLADKIAWLVDGAERTRDEVHDLERNNEISRARRMAGIQSYYTRQLKDISEGNPYWKDALSLARRWRREQ